MKFWVEMICMNEDGVATRRKIMEMARGELAMETLGLSLAEGKALLQGVQVGVASYQISEELTRRRVCANCGQRYHGKAAGTSTVETVYGPVTVPNPRWERCPCQTDGPRTFRPTAAWLKGRTSPERLYLETKWGSLLPYAKVVDLLKEVLPVSESTNHETVRAHLHAMAERMEDELGEERQPDPVTPELDLELPVPDGPMMVGLDGGYVRAAHKTGCFEVIAGRSLVAFRRRAEDAVPPPKCFGFVQTYDPKPRRRLWEVMKSQGMQANQQVVFLSDGGEDIRQVREYLHPTSDHVIDWFHITMRLTVLQQQTKGLANARPETGAEVSRHLERIKWYLWHGNTYEALQHLESLEMDLDAADEESKDSTTHKLLRAVEEFHTYIANNQAFIPNYGERYRQGERISTGFVESAVNYVVAKRFTKRQQMQWSPKGAHLLLQMRTRVLNGELEQTFREWHPGFRLAGTDNLEKAA